MEIIEERIRIATERGLLGGRFTYGAEDRSALMGHLHGALLVPADPLLEDGILNS